MSVPVQLSPQFDQQFFSNNGIPLAGGFIYTYAAGTTTPLAAYTDSTGNTPQTNPIVLDGNGRAPIWLGSAAYKLVLQDANNVTLWTVDNVSYINVGSITSAMIAPGAVGSTQIANGAVGTTQLAANAVTAAKIANNTITATQIAANTIGAGQITNGSLTTTQLSPTAGILASQLAVSAGLSLGATTTYFYTFTVFSANATINATYSNNSNIFTVLSTISGGTTLVCSSNGAPASGATTLTKISGTGDGTISISASTSAGTYSWVPPTGIARGIIEACGGGGGGGGGGTGGTPGSSGGNTVFNGITLGYGGTGGYPATYGNPGSGFNAIDWYSGGAGVSSTGAGSAGNGSQFYIGGGGGIAGGGKGGGGGGASSYAVGGAGGQGNGPFNGYAGSLGSGGGGGANASTGNSGGGGGGCRKSLSVQPIPSGAITISIGAGGSGSNNSYSTGGTGGDGFLVIYY
jgi:hypothetical protein